MWRRHATVALVLAMLAAPAASAQPTVWERARDPRTQEAYDLLVAVEAVIDEPIEGPADLMRRHRALREAVALLEAHDARSLPDVRLKYLLADLLGDVLINGDREARTLLEEALAAAPHSALAGRGWYLLGVACAKLGDPATELFAYTRALETIHDRNLRSNILLNRGETSMVLGDLPSAIADYRRAVALATDFELISLAYYGLGISLERHGDLPAALQAMLRARAHWPALAPYTAIDQPHVFFVPSYDLYYYKALEAMALARKAARDREPDEQLRYLRRAIENWTSYINAAEPEGNPYVSNARLHLRACERELARREHRGERAVRPR